MNADMNGTTALDVVLPDLAGEPYEQVLARMHKTLKPETYLEIGCWTGGSLELSSARTIAVDPQFRLPTSVIGQKPACLLFQMTSDAFFRQYSPSALLGQPLDMAFLDGMHLAEFLLRDFINTERHCRKNSVIFLHDCAPVDATITDRAIETERRRTGNHPGWWAGDVWKTVVTLKAARPDLMFTAWDAAPTGLIGITNLDPTSTVLADRYFDLVKPYESLDLQDYGIRRYFSEINLQSTQTIQSTEDIAALFWL